eukprot:4792585-Amphidinium_carterae.1
MEAAQVPTTACASCRQPDLTEPLGPWHACGACGRNICMKCSLDPRVPLRGKKSPAHPGTYLQ